jgi:hypothetical protein
MPVLLSRDEFREKVFSRDHGKCVFCGEPAVDAHHILDRKLFSDGGYYLDNGASVCADDHMRCETTEYPVELVREKAGIVSAILPTGFDPEAHYDKWGNVLLDDGRRFQGPLFHDTAVQKLLKRDLWMYEETDEPC